MPTISLTLPVAGNVVTAGLHATNYTSIQGVINGGLDTANWASGLIFAPSKVMQEGATKYQSLLWNGSNWAASGPHPQLYARATTAVDVQNTVTETSLFTQSISGNDLSTNRMLRLTMKGDRLKNNAAGDTLRVRVKFGGTTFISALALSATGDTISANRQPWRLVVEVANLGATNSQFIDASMNYVERSNAAAPTTGIGQFAFDEATGPGQGTVALSALGTIDTTTAQTLDVTAQWSAASANNSWRQRYAVLELI